jgi:hypothetical protein
VAAEGSPGIRLKRLLVRVEIADMTRLGEMKSGEIWKACKDALLLVHPDKESHVGAEVRESLFLELDELRSILKLM